MTGLKTPTSYVLEGTNPPMHIFHVTEEVGTKVSNSTSETANRQTWPAKRRTGLVSSKFALAKLMYRHKPYTCLLYTSPSPRDSGISRMPSSA